MPTTQISQLVADATQPSNSELVAILTPVDPTITTDTPITDQNLSMQQWADQVRGCMSSPEKIVVNANGKAVCSPNPTASASPGSLTIIPETPQQPEVFVTQEGVRIFKETRDAVLIVNNRGYGAGSGFIISNDGYIITNAHVVANLTAGQEHILEVKTEFEDKRIPAELIAFDYQGHDLALLKIDRQVSKTLSSAKSIKIGEPIYVIGSPFSSNPNVGLLNLITSGIVSGVTEKDVITDAAINSGNSGGPLLNSSLEFVGVATSSFGPNGFNIGINYAIPAKQVEEFRTNVKKGRFALVAQHEGRNKNLAEANLKLPTPFLSIGSTVSGQIDREDLEYGNEIYEFAGTSGQKVTITVQGDGNFAPLLIIEQLKDTAEKPVYRNSARPKLNSTIAQLEFQFPEDGKYRLIVNPLKKLKDNETGTYKLTIR